MLIQNISHLVCKTRLWKFHRWFIYHNFLPLIIILTCARQMLKRLKNSVYHVKLFEICVRYFIFYISLEMFEEHLKRYWLQGFFSLRKLLSCQKVNTLSWSFNTQCSSVSDSKGLVIVKLKRKLHYRGYIYFESERPDFILFIFRLSQFLKVNYRLIY